MDGSTRARSPRWYVTIAILRGLLTTVVVLALYYTLPLDLDGATSAALRVLMGFVMFVGGHDLAGTRREDIDDTGSAGHRCRVPGGAALPRDVRPLYYVMGQNDASTFSEDLSRSDALYFTITTFATVGFGDITPKGETARLVVPRR